MDDRRVGAKILMGVTKHNFHTVKEKRFGF